MDIADAVKVKGLAVGRKDYRDSLDKNGPKYMRWALIEAATHAPCNPVYAERYQRTKTRLGRQRGAKVARVDLVRRLAEAIWYMLTTSKPVAPAGAAKPLPHRRPSTELRHRSEAPPIRPVLPEEAIERRARLPIHPAGPRRSRSPARPVSPRPFILPPGPRA